MKMASILSNGSFDHQADPEFLQLPLDVLVADVSRDGFHAGLFGRETLAISPLLKTRRTLFMNILDAYIEFYKELNLNRSAVWELWERYLPLAQFLTTQIPGDSQNFVVGFAGGPGSGKSTAAKILEFLIEKISGRKVLRLSLDDFYLPIEVRRARGFQWRAAPGTHDLDLLVKLLHQFRSGTKTLAVPSYDLDRDTQVNPKQIFGPFDICILEGWIVGWTKDGYHSVSSQLDYLVYFDAAEDVLRRSRLKREADIQQRSNRQCGLSEAQMLAFWDDMLAPGLKKWVIPIRPSADLVIMVADGPFMISASLRER